MGLQPQAHRVAASITYCCRLKSITAKMTELQHKQSGTEAASWEKWQGNLHPNPTPTLPLPLPLPLTPTPTQARTRWVMWSSGQEGYWATVRKPCAAQVRVRGRDRGS